MAVGGAPENDALRSEINRRMVTSVIRAAQREGADLVDHVVSLLDARDRVLDERDEQLALLEQRIASIERLVNQQAARMAEVRVALQRLGADAQAIGQQLRDATD